MDARSFARLILAGMCVVSLMMMQSVVAQSGTGDPDPVDSLLTGASGRYNGQTTGYGISAVAGNVTALTIQNFQATQFWQGYYGNITGEIKLDDASNNTLFSWSLANPVGEIYAVNNSGTVQWGNITCVNLTSAANTTDTIGKINRTTIQSAYNLTDQDFDNLSSTFNQSYSAALVVGARTIPASLQCPEVNTYVDEAWQTTSYSELLLHDNLSSLVFAAIIERNVDGFRAGSNDAHDFQMMVLEDGTPGGPDASMTTYYFYVELN